MDRLTNRPIVQAKLSVGGRVFEGVTDDNGLLPFHVAIRPKAPVSIVLPRELGGLTLPAQVSRGDEEVTIRGDVYAVLEYRISSTPEKVTQYEIKATALPAIESFAHRLSEPQTKLLTSMKDMPAQYRQRLDALGIMPEKHLVQAVTFYCSTPLEREIHLPFDGRIASEFVPKRYFVGSMTFLECRRGQVLEIDLNIQRLARIAGRVVDSQGRAVAKARVVVTSTTRVSDGDDRVIPAGGSGRGIVRHPGNTFVWERIRRSTESGEDGSFEVLLSSTKNLTVASFDETETRGAAVIEFPGDRDLHDHSEILLSLTRGPQQWVRVVDRKGQPLALHAFSVYPANHPDSMVFYPPAKAGEEGWLDTTNLKAGRRYKLVPLFHRQQSIEFVLRPGLILDFDL